jgi:hypothetical protein
VIADDLWREFNNARRAMTRADRDTLAALGIDPADMLFLVGFSRGRIVGNHLYEPDESGKSSFVTPVLVHHAVSPETNCPAQACRFGEVVDLVAWHPEAPRAFALRCGRAQWLGSYEPQFMAPYPVSVHRGVLAWLRSGCRGIVLLTTSSAQRYRVVANIQRIEAADAAHAQELKAVLQWPWPTPQIGVARRREARRVA